MFSERQYSGFGLGHKNGRFSILYAIILVNIAAFLIETVLERLFATEFFNLLLSLSPKSLKGGAIWEFFTYSIVHANLTHILLNMLGLYFAGKWVESVMGNKNFFALYAFGVFLGAIFWLFGAAFSPRGASEILCGASAGVLGVVAAFCMLYPKDKYLTALVFFVLPIRVKPRVFLYIIAGYEIFALLTMELSMPNYDIANSAHIGGIVAGVLFAFLYKGNKLDFGKMAIRTPEKKMRAADFNFEVNIVDTEKLKSEVNRILDKVAKKGFNSLSQSERETLKKAKDYMD
ncbi:MAG: rhomboid family intramembrane serine protease [Opitutales bacterium]|nr:rhomboid family intramembrane serine protease [Opitutales bacterium]